MEKVGEEVAPLAEDAAQDFGDSEDKLAVRNFITDAGSDPYACGAHAALMTSGAEMPPLTGEG